MTDALVSFAAIMSKCELLMELAPHLPEEVVLNKVRELCEVATKESTALEIEARGMIDKADRLGDHSLANELREKMAVVRGQRDQFQLAFAALATSA